MIANQNIYSPFRTYLGLYLQAPEKLRDEQKTLVEIVDRVNWDRFEEKFEVDKVTIRGENPKKFVRFLLNRYFVLLGFELISENERDWMMFRPKPDTNCRAHLSVFYGVHDEEETVSINVDADQ